MKEEFSLFQSNSKIVSNSRIVATSSRNFFRILKS